MTRRRIILAILALLLTTFVIAVQRDTFVRRWCLPAPQPSTRPLGPLDQVIDEFQIDDSRDVEMLRELQRRGGVHIRQSEFEAIFRASPTPPCTIRQATVEQLLCRIYCIWDWPVDDPAVIDADGFVGQHLTRSSPTIVRVHTVDRLLLKPGVQLTQRWFTTAEHDLIQQLEPCTQHNDGNNFAFDPILRFGDNVIVVTTARTHWLIDQVLREEADAQKPKLTQPAATLPAK